MIARTAADIREVLIDGESGILAISPPDFRPKYEPTKRRLTWPNGATAVLLSADEPDSIRGINASWAICDEIAAWKYIASWSNLMFGLRLPSKLGPQVAAATTPKPCPLLAELKADAKKNPEAVIIIGGSTYENRENLDAKFFNDIVTRYEGTRLGRQELDGELLEDVPGALWTQQRIDDLRVDPKDAPEMRRIVVAIDPSTTSGEESNECGIVACGKGVDGDAYTLADRSGIMTPYEWAMAAITLFHELHADAIIGEANNGGDLIETVLRTIDPTIPYRKVHASRGKTSRAEPISALAEQGREHHVGPFPELEKQMCAMTGEGYTGAGSPDRCFIAGTMIQTPSGARRIEEIKVGDEVSTRSGSKKVIACGVTSRRADVKCAVFSDGTSLIATGNHPVFIKNKGFVPVNALVWDDIIVSWQETASRLTGSRFTGTLRQSKGRTGFTTQQTKQPASRAAKAACIGTFTKNITGQSQMAESSTMTIKTPGITTQETSSASQEKHTERFTFRRPQNLGAKISLRLLPLLQNGIRQMPESSGTVSRGKRLGRRASRLGTAFVGYAVRVPLFISRERGFAPESASISKRKQTNDITKTATAKYAQNRFSSKSRSRKLCARISVRGLFDAGVATVYNLTVADAHEYFANGILVHNCDAKVWAETELSIGSGVVQMFPDFRARQRGQSEPKHACHVVDLKPDAIKDWWPRWISAAVGQDSAAHWWLREPDGRVRIYRELVMRDVTAEDFGAAIADRSQTECRGSRIVPVWLGESAFDLTAGKSPARSVYAGLTKSLGAHKSFLFVHDERERQMEENARRVQSIQNRLSVMPKGTLSVQSIKSASGQNKDQSGWDVIREMLRWRPKLGETKPEAPDWDHAMQLAYSDMPAYHDYIRQFRAIDGEVLPVLTISTECVALIQAMSGASRSTADQDKLAEGTMWFLLQSLRIGALASREESGTEPMEEFVGRRLDSLATDAPPMSRHMVALKAEADWKNKYSQHPLNFRRAGAGRQTPRFAPRIH